VGTLRKILKIAFVSGFLMRAGALAYAGSTKNNCIEQQFGFILNEELRSTVVYPDQPSAEFKSIFYRDENGRRMVDTKLIPEGSLGFFGDGRQRFVGRIISTMDRGEFSILDERTGQIIRIEERFLESARTKPPNLRWERTSSNDPPKLARLIETTDHPYALVTFMDGFDQNRSVYGKLSKQEPEPGYWIYSIEEKSGIVHRFDSSSVRYNAVITNGSTEAKSLFPTLKSGGAPLNLIDKNAARRLKWAKSVIKSGNIFDDPEMYQFLESDLEATKRLMYRWYHGKREDAWVESVMKQTEASLGGRYVSLLADPAVLSRADQFIAFGKAHLARHPGISSFGLRTAFSKHLGTRKIYRGMTLTEEEVKAIKMNGIAAAGMLNSKDIPDAIFKSFDPALRIGTGRYFHSPQDDISLRLAGSTENSLYISVTDHEPIAASVGFHASGRQGLPGNSLYVFEIEIPELSLVKRQHVFRPLFNGGVQVEKSKYKAGDPGIEMFVPYKINSQYIKSVQKYQNPPKKWGSLSSSSRSGEVVRPVEPKIANPEEALPGAEVFPDRVRRVFHEEDVLIENNGSWNKMTSGEIPTPIDDKTEALFDYPPYQRIYGDILGKYENGDFLIEARLPTGLLIGTGIQRCRWKVRVGQDRIIKATSR